MSDPIKVILADDHAFVIEGLQRYLSDESDITIIETVNDGEQLLDAVHRLKPDVVISDIQMPHLDGFETLQKIRSLSPDVRVLFLTAFTDGQTLQKALSSGVDGLILKTDPPEQTVNAVRQVMAGQMVFPAAARRWIAQAPQPESPPIALSEREQEVLALVAQGLTNIEVAKALQISANTVKFHLQNIFVTIGAANRTEASRWYLEQFPQ